MLYPWESLWLRRGGPRRGRSPSAEAWIEVDDSWNEDQDGCVEVNDPLATKEHRRADPEEPRASSLAGLFRAYIERSLQLEPEVAEAEMGFLHRIGMEVFVPATASIALARACMLRRSLPDVDPRLAQVLAQATTEIPAATQDNPMGAVLGDTTLLLLLASSIGRSAFFDFIEGLEDLNTASAAGGAVAVNGGPQLEASHAWMLRVLPGFLVSSHAHRVAYYAA